MTLPKYLEENLKKKSQKQEKKLVVRLQAGSGSLWGAKGDVRTNDELWEHKGTQKKQMIVKEEWLKKIFEEGVKEGRMSCICLEFEGFKLMGTVVKKVRG